MTTPSARFPTPGFALCAAVLAAAAALLASPALGQDNTYKPGKSKERAPARKDSKEKTLREEGEALFGPGQGKPAGGDKAAASHWSIVIEAFREEDQAAQAQAGLTKVRDVAGLSGAYLDQRGSATVIAYGRYPDPRSAEAVADLKKVQNLEVVVNGAKQKPFAAAFLAPPETIPGSIPEYDLANAKKVHGDWVLYTLQVGVYSNEDPRKKVSAADIAEFRRTAEQAVVQLRREGEQAFYYHGPNRSMVTIGLFGIEDFDPQQPKVMSPTLSALRKRFPHNLQNGMGIRMRVTVTDPATGRKIRQEKLQPSGLMNVPEPPRGG